MFYFSHRSAAKRYARSRPYFHPTVIEDARHFLKLTSPLPWALDVGCGTGQSAIALKEIANHTVGADISEEMLTEAQTDPHVSYIRATAEQLPFASNSFDIVSAGLAFHWFDRALFLSEASRVLKPRGWLIIYNNVFTAVMRENPEYEAWVHAIYGSRYPPPPRNNQPITDTDAQVYGLRFAGQEDLTNEVVFTPEEVAAYMMTHTNVIAAIEQGTERPEHVYDWLLTSMSPFFPLTRCTFIFASTIWYLQKRD